MKSFKQYVAEELVNITEAEDSAVTKKVTKSDPDAMHVGTAGHEHVYAGAGDGGEHVYHVHNTKTGQTHTATLDHGGTDTYSHAEVHKELGGDSKVSKAASKIAHNDHKKEMKMYGEEYTAVEVSEDYDDHMDKASNHAIQADHHRELAKDAAKSGDHDAGAHHRMAADLHKTAAKKYEKAADSGNTMHAATAKTAGKKAMQAAQKAKSLYD